VPYLAGPELTAADIIMVFSLTTMGVFAPRDLASHPNLRAYLKRMAWMLLLVAGALEIAWAIGLKLSEGFTRPVASVLTLIAVASSFLLLAQALKTIPVGTGYAVWTGIGAAGTAVVGMLLFSESSSPARLACLALIVLGIVGLKLTSPG
jgi:quaternary ammonium compound-resistance protein SugE